MTWRADIRVLVPHVQGVPTAFIRLIGRNAEVHGAKVRIEF